jgi:hypothetical protein
MLYYFLFSYSQSSSVSKNLVNIDLRHDLNYVFAIVSISEKYDFEIESNVDFHFSHTLYIKAIYKMKTTLIIHF